MYRGCYWRAIVDKIGIAKVYFGSGIPLVLSTVLIPLAGKNLALIIVLRLIGGAGVGPIITSISRLAAEWFPMKERGLITGKVGGMAMGLGLFGGVVGVSIGSATITKTGNYQASILIVTIVAIVGFFVAMALRKPKAFEHLHEK